MIRLARVNQAFCDCSTTPTHSTFFGLFASLLSDWATTAGRLLGANGNKPEVSFPRTQRRIAGSGIELGVSNILLVSNLSITDPTLYQLSYRRHTGIFIVVFYSNFLPYIIGTVSKDWLLTMFCKIRSVYAQCIKFTTYRFFLYKRRLYQGCKLDRFLFEFKFEFSLF